MSGRVAALYRHPVKGFTPERLASAVLEAGAYFPCDRLYAVENGPSGFDADAPVHLSKSHFAVLASIPMLARIRTRYDEGDGMLSVTLDGASTCRFALLTDTGRVAFAHWLEGIVDPQDRRGELRLLPTAGAHRFTDDRAGAVSLLNLASVRDLAARLGRPVDPLRFRANIHIDGWPAWAELDLAPGAEISLGEATARVVKPIVRCAATHVDPASGVRDLDLVPALFGHYSRLTCGLYLQVAWGGRVAEGDRARPADLPGIAPPPRADDAPAIHLN
ncbi:MAG TPA: MOSC N-terminal beta barrel domain-containing protein [Caulobacteraceae bacterium]|jgi:uncharacterized protein YcbX|nr:MOSC N-terminal beta barrel domain-containing protein [Caulobacteraceae bacterium]